MKSVYSFLVKPKGKRYNNSKKNWQKRINIKYRGI